MLHIPMFGDSALVLVTFPCSAHSPPQPSQAAALAAREARRGDHKMCVCVCNMRPWIYTYMCICTYIYTLYIYIYIQYRHIQFNCRCLWVIFERCMERRILFWSFSTISENHRHHVGGCWRLRATTCKKAAFIYENLSSACGFISIYDIFRIFEWAEKHMCVTKNSNRHLWFSWPSESSDPKICDATSFSS